MLNLCSKVYSTTNNSNKRSSTPDLDRDRPVWLSTRSDYQALFGLTYNVKITLMIVPQNCCCCFVTRCKAELSYQSLGSRFSPTYLKYAKLERARRCQSRHLCAFFSLSEIFFRRSVDSLSVFRCVVVHSLSLSRLCLTLSTKNTHMFAVSHSSHRTIVFRPTKKAAELLIKMFRALLRDGDVCDL